MKSVKLCLIFALACICFASACAQSSGGAAAPASEPDPASDSAAGATAGGDSFKTTTGAEQAATPQADVEQAAAPSAEVNQSPAPPASADIRVTLIGDSVVLGGVDAVKAAVPGVEIRARNDRKLAGSGLDMLKKEAADGELGQIVVLALGTNFVAVDDIDKAMAVIGNDRQVVFVNAYRGGAGYIDEVNKAISEAAGSHSSNFTIADWHGYVASHPNIKLAPDNCHLTKSSAEDYANVIKTGVDSAAAKLTGKHRS